MRLIINDYVGYDFVYSLCKELSNIGHEVYYVTCVTSAYPAGRKSSHNENLKIISIDLGRNLKKEALFSRRRFEIEYGRESSKLIKSILPDFVISSNMPLESQKVILKLCKSLKIRSYHWWQDVYGIATAQILAKKLPVFGGLIGRYYINLERNLLKGSSGIIAITPLFVRYLKEWSIDTPVLIQGNWSDTDIFRHNYGNESDRIEFIYSGTLSLKHNPKRLLDVANMIQGRPEVSLKVVSEGREVEWLKNKVDEANLERVIFLDFQDPDAVPSMLSRSSICIVLLEEDAGDFSVPSKTLTYASAGKPILASMPLTNDAAKMIVDNQMGLVSSPSDGSAFIENATLLMNASTLRISMGKNARNYAIKNFNIPDISSKILDFVQKNA